MGHVNSSETSCYKPPTDRKSEPAPSRPRLDAIAQDFSLTLVTIVPLSPSILLAKFSNMSEVPQLPVMFSLFERGDTHAPPPLLDAPIGTIVSP